MRNEDATLASLMGAALPPLLSKALTAQDGFALWAGGERLETRMTGVERDGTAVIRRFTVPEARTEVEQRFFPDKQPGVVVIRMRLVQPDAGPSLPLERVQPIHLRLQDARKDPSGLRNAYAVSGGTYEGYYPPYSFRAHQVRLLDRGGSGAFRIASPAGGRSSDEFLPFLLFQMEAGGESAGVVASMEWSGEWEMEVNCGVPGTLNVSYKALDDLFIMGGPKVDGLVLEPGEVLDMPPAHLVFFQGGMEAGFNATRRYVHQRVCPRIGGKPPLPPYHYNSWYGLATEVDEESIMRQVSPCAEIGLEYFVLDAGWFPGTQGSDFMSGVGNWGRVNLDKFPRGLLPLAQEVRRRGMKPGLWFDFEHAQRSSDIRTQHPDWFWDIDTDDLHLDLTIPEAQEHILETVSGWIQRLDLGWVKLDYNIDPAPYWSSVDPTGKVQFGYMRGLYRVLDELISRHPRVIIETCASGGKRIDLGTIRRAHTAWITDHADEPHVCRYAQTGASRLLPGNLLISCVPARSTRRDLPNPGLEFLSRMVGTFAIHGDVASWEPAVRAEAARHVEAFKAVRHLLPQDFYPLTRQPAGVEDWDAVQFVDYEGSESAVFAFRMGGDQDERRLPLRGLRPGKRYTVTQPLATHGPTELAVSDSGAVELPVRLDSDQGKLYHVRLG